MLQEIYQFTFCLNYDYWCNLQFATFKRAKDSIRNMKIYIYIYIFRTFLYSLHILITFARIAHLTWFLRFRLNRKNIKTYKEMGCIALRLLYSLKLLLKSIMPQSRFHRNCMCTIFAAWKVTLSRSKIRHRFGMKENEYFHFLRQNRVSVFMKSENINQFVWNYFGNEFITNNFSFIKIIFTNLKSNRQNHVTILLLIFADLIIWIITVY